MIRQRIFRRFRRQTITIATREKRENNEKTKAVLLFRNDVSTLNRR